MISVTVQLKKVIQKKIINAYVINYKKHPET